jgi:hypothetical protein
MNRSLFSVADPDPGSGAFLTPGSGDVQKIRIWIRSEQPGSYFSEPKQFFGLKYINSLMWIRDPGCKNSNPGSGMEKSRIRDPEWKKVGSEIRDKHQDPQHCHCYFLKLEYTSK